ncbi:hypothetical protein IT411_02690 [Candidatus Peregrinibacteria bacterium]|nr:hypothetical protein [Candidatus Peregrinibacteria bacterium]
MSEFESLRSEAAQDRNHPAAIAKINNVTEKILERIKRLNDLRFRLTELMKETRERIPNEEERIRRLIESLRADTNRLDRMRGVGRNWEELSRRIEDKDRQLKRMQDNLAKLKTKLYDLEFG